ncbi:effector binding domain-containing protein [Paenibacillus sp. MBLB4367]|uniref:effector binding domain-containing protein n=1 Tax=Paenibacillus sp. MBLB4367 TaxID=3384767 RepID=UPI0039081503
MSEAVNIQDVVQVRNVTIGAVRLIGIQGGKLEDQHDLFAQMEARVGEIASRKSDHPYLIILPNGLVPLVAVEVEPAGEVPEGMVAYTLPEDEYVLFHFAEAHIGEFWGSICSEENQVRYGIDLSKPRFEMFAPNLQPKGMVEWYLPVKRG